LTVEGKMTKGSWIVVGIFGLLCLSSWLSEITFLDKNVWRNGELRNADAVTREVDFLAMRVQQYVSSLHGFTFFCLLTVLLYFAVRVRHLERRVEGLERQAQLNSGRGELVAVGDRLRD
jgi:hypothetical protein